MRILAALAFISTVSSTAAFGQMLRIQQVIGRDDLVPIEMALGTPSYDHARSVGYVNLGGAGCTGFRVAEDLFLTNHHCYAAGSCARTTFTLGQERDMPRDRQSTMRCQEVLAYNSALDYALYRVQTTATDTMAQFPAVVLSSYLPPVNAPLLVPGYPCCENFKRADLSADCKLLSQGDGRSAVGYGCDTISGSSGSPVMDRQTGHVVALHWGYSVAGSNNGYPMRAILEDIKTKAPAAYEKLTIADN